MKRVSKRTHAGELQEENGQLGPELGRADPVGQQHHPGAHQGQVGGPLKAQAHGHLLPGHPHVRGQVQVLPANAHHQDPTHELAARHKDGLLHAQ